MLKKNLKNILIQKFLDSPEGDTPIKDVVSSINWIFDQNKKIVGGRNFSTAYDPWGTGHTENSNLIEKLENEKNIYKLRRFGNDLFPNKRY